VTRPTTLRSTLTPVLALAAVLLAVAGLATAAEPEDDPPISFVLEDASARDVLEVLASLRKLELRIDPDVTGTVTVDLKAVPLSMALDEVCRQVDCEWQIEDGTPAVLRVKSTGEPVRRVTLDIVDRPLREAIVELETESGLSLSVSESLDPELPVTLEVERQPLSEVLQDLVAQIGGRWSLRSGVYQIYPDVRDQPGGDPEAHVPQPMAVGIRMSRLGEEVSAPRRMTLSWSRPVVTWPLPSGGKLQLVLSWLPLGAEHARLLPLLIGCGGEQPRLVRRFPLVDPAAGETQVLQVGELTVEIVTDPPPSWREERPPAAPPVCGRTEAQDLSIRIGKEGEYLATLRHLPELPGRFWLAAGGVYGPRRPEGETAGALVYLGRDSADPTVRRLLLLTGGGSGGITTRPVQLAGDESAELRLDHGGGRDGVLVLRVRATD
jgi:hypothetical protein